MSSVGFRERCRPMFSEIRDFLSERAVTHAQVTMPRMQHGPLPWGQSEETSGGFLLEWGCHALDYTRFMTGLEVAQVQAFRSQPEGHEQTLSDSVNFRFSNGGTMHLLFVTLQAQDVRAPGRRVVPLFSFAFVGGWVDVYREGGKIWPYEINGEHIRTEEFDPWAGHDRVFIEAVRSCDAGAVPNDYDDGLKTVGPILAAIESTREGGKTIDVAPPV